MWLTLSIARRRSNGRRSGRYATSASNIFRRAILYYFHKGTGDDRLRADASGCAAGNTLEEAIVQGFLELVERDACAIWWYNRLRRPAVDLGRFGDNYIDDLRTQFAAAGRQIWALDITTDLEVPVVVAVCHWQDQSKEHVVFAAGAHFDPRFAALRALTELNQALAVDAMAVRPAIRQSDRPRPAAVARSCVFARAWPSRYPGPPDSEFLAPGSAGTGACLRGARQTPRTRFPRP